MPRILEVIGAGGFDLYGLHLIPSCAERWTLNVDLGGCWSPSEMEALERELQRLAGIIQVIHPASVAHAA